MAWQMPAVAAGQWTAAMAMPQEMNMTMNMGSYTPEQWAALQQQNWQQWTQWQQQYAQWQTQFGDKYAQHIQTGLPMAGMPPLPVSAAAPPAPPPPDQPPPPLPHENNQPLFGSKSQPSAQTSAGTTQQTTSNYSNTKPTTGNNQWSYGIESSKEALSTVNSDALKKLAEEEKSFDIQFQKWEEEIERWRKENVNHPDKQSYKEYEEKFELCRAQLLERRQQMNLKKARLLSSASQAANPSGNTPTPVPPPPSNNTQNNYNQSVQSQNSNKNTYQQDYNSQASFNRSNNKNIDPQDRYESYQNVDDGKKSSQNSYPSAKSDPTTFLPTSSSSKGIPGLDLVPEVSHDRKNLEIVDITDDTEFQQAPDYSKISKGINNILGDAKIMNILSMVQGQLPPANAAQNAPLHVSNSTSNQNFVSNQVNRNTNNFEQDQFGNRQNMPYNRQGPNNSMQVNQGMISQYSQQQGMYEGQEMQQDRYYDRNAHYGPGGPNNRGGANMRQGGPDMRQGGPDMRQGGPDMRQGGPDMRQGGLDMRQGGHDMRQGGPDMRQGGPDMRQGGPDMRQGGPDMRQGGPDTRQGGPDMRQGGFDIRQGGNMLSGGPDMRYGSSDMRHPGPGMQQGGPEIRQSGPGIRPGGPDIRQGGPDMSQAGPNIGQGGPHMTQVGTNVGQGGPHMQQSLLQDMRRPGHSNLAVESTFHSGSIPPLMSFNNRPPLQDMGSQQNANDYYGQNRPIHENNPVMIQPPRRKWVDESLFSPSLVVDYEHKPLRLKARDFIEPVHTFDYNHRSKDEDLNKTKDFEKEVEELFVRKPRRNEDVREGDRYTKDLYHRDFERRIPREDVRDMRDIREEYRESRDDFRDRMRERPREAHREDFERWRSDDLRFDERRRDDRRDDRDRLYKRDDFRERERDRDPYRLSNRDDRNRDVRRDEHKNRSISKDRDSRKRSFSKENDVSVPKKPKENIKSTTDEKKHIVMIDDLLEPPGRGMRPVKMVIILRGIPGSGKSYLAKLIRDKEAEHGGTARIMSIDDYFMHEGEIEEKDPQTGKTVKKPFLKYEYDETSEESYLTSLKRAFKRSLTDGYFSFLIYDAVNEQLKNYADIWNFARQNGFQVYVCTMEQDVQTCFKRNIHNRKLEDLEVLAARFFPTPAHHIQLDATTLLQSAAIAEVHMEDVEDDVVMEDVQEVEVESVFTSKWEKMDDAAQLARLDGTSKPLRPSQLSMEDYLQLDEWQPNKAKPGKKSVRWADIEEKREQEKMRAIGFVVGQTDWNRMTDPTMGSSALTQTKYIERVRRK